ncbi:RodZ family helix-turn-helix domain-containing protein [Thalassoroseus pseudoceratinae]|uniref:hypothetical protein n=1 Tax=Thalassoroseus pseudoceratinae TaxID=2713176 RepID=UPI00141E05BA|nr:hypothetical protein [Thalassoroseus pseudoceratinae]
MVHRTLLIFVVVFSYATSVSAQIREWKSGDRTVRGQYVGIRGLNVVIVNSEGEKQELPYFLQSSSSQAFVREQLRRKDDLDLLPKAGAERTWTQNNGVTFAGRLAGVDENYVFILTDGNVQAVDKARLSRLDVVFAEDAIRDLERGNGSEPPPEETPAITKPENTDSPSKTPNETNDDSSPPSSTDFFNGSNPMPATEDEDSNTAAPSNGEDSPNRTAREESRRKAMASVASQRPFYVPPSNDVKSFNTTIDVNANGAVTYGGSGGGLNFIQIVAIVLTIAAIAAVAMQYTGQRKAS